MMMVVLRLPAEGGGPVRDGGWSFVLCLRAVLDRALYGMENACLIVLVFAGSYPK